MNNVGTIKGRYGTIHYWKTDTCITPIVATYGEYFETEVDIFRLYCGPGDTVVDVGTNIGTHTMALASLVGPKGRVIGIEPQRPIFMLMCVNAVMNNYLQVEPYRAVAGTEVRKGDYALFDYNYPGDSGGYQAQLMAALAVGQDAREMLETLTLDYIGCHKAKLIKIDVEGAEAEVIAGAKTSIGLGRPVLYVENNVTDKSQELIRLLRTLDYKLYWHIPASFNPDNIAGSKTIIHPVGLNFAKGQFWVNGMGMNMLCLPAEKQLPVPQDVIEVGSDEEHPCLPEYRARLLPGFKMLGLTDAA